MIQAWLLDLGAGRWAAVGDREQVHLLHDPAAHRVPWTPRSASQVLLWNGRCVPVVDLGIRLGDVPSYTVSRLLGLYAYLESPGNAVAFGALWLAAAPRRISLDAPRMVDLPSPQAAWREVAISCFQWQDAPVPVLDLTRVFGRPKIRCEESPTVALTA
jgi:hypothetical protein